jgi:hypothetical protein
MENSQTEVNFSELVLGFSSAALYYLGEAQVDGKNVKTENVALARQNIEFLNLLQRKTQGNLTDEEHKLLEQVLADLKMKFVAHAKS